MERIDREAIQKTQEEKEKLDALSIKDMLKKIDETIPEVKE